MEQLKKFVGIASKYSGYDGGFINVNPIAGVSVFKEYIRYRIKTRLATVPSGIYEKDYYEEIVKYCQSDVAKIIVNYMLDIPIGYKFVDIFKTKTNSNSFVIDKYYLYVLEENATIIKKYNINNGEIINSFGVCTRGIDEIYLCDIACSKKWIVFVDYIKMDILVFNKKGALKTKIKFNLSKMSERLGGNNMDQFCMQYESQQKLDKAKSGVNLTINDDNICVAIFYNLICFDINGNIQYDDMFDDIINDIVITDQIFVRWGSFISRIILIDKIPIIHSFNIPQTRVGSIRGIGNNIAIRHNLLYVKELRGFSIFDFNGNLISKIENEYCLRYYKIFMTDSRIYILCRQIGTDNLEIRVYELVF